MDKEYEYENLVKGYERTIEAQADMIQKQQKFIKWLLISIVFMFSITIIGSVVAWSVYMYAPVIDTTNFNGDNNMNMTDNNLDSTNINDK